MHRCVIAPLQRIYGRCSGRIQWHHPWIYAGKQINEPWAIVGACEGHHDEVTKDRAIKQAFETDSLMRATDEDLAKYPRKDWEQIKRTLGITRRKNGRKNNSQT